MDPFGFLLSHCEIDLKDQKAALAVIHVLQHRVKMPGQTFVVVADPTLLPAVLGRPGLPKSRVYELGFFVSAAACKGDTLSL